MPKLGTGMGELVTVIPDEFHFVTRTARTLAEVAAYIRSAHEVALKVNKHISVPEELTISCYFWPDGAYWTVKVDLFCSDTQSVAFHAWWAWR